MDKLAERLSQWFGSAPFLLLHVIWFIVWFVLGLKTDLLTLIVSLEAIFLTILILRAENVSQNRMEKFIKRDLKKSNKVIKKLNKR